MPDIELIGPHLLGWPVKRGWSCFTPEEQKRMWQPIKLPSPWDICKSRYYFCSSKCKKFNSCTWAFNGANGSCK